MNGKLTLPSEPQRIGPLQTPLIYVKEKILWEYKQIVRDLEKESAPDEAELNNLGAEGWEMSGILTIPPHVYFYFKRSSIK